MQRVALVTGSNRGIGFEACRQLAQAGLLVIATSRDEALGREAVEQLRREGLEVRYYPLDVADHKAVMRVKEFVEKEFGQLDVLVNNAGVYLDADKSVFEIPVEVMRETLEINLYGAFHLIRAFVPMMREKKYGRIVNVSSGLGMLSDMQGRTASYKISKVALNALTVIVADELRGDNIKVNTMSPGWVQTRMGGEGAPTSPAEGVDTIIWLATLPDKGPTGGFFENRKSIDW
jgi:NAD(P)-dependent dehydrogenase (short-subunit alcohol dehydrogenase family)